MTNITDYATGIYEDIPASVYHQKVLGLVNNGAIGKLLKTPAHYRAWLDEEDGEETRALTFGRALHCAILEPSVFEATYMIPVEHPFRKPSIRQREAKKPSDETLKAIAYWDTWNKKNAGLIEISYEEKQRLIGMSKSIRAHPIASKLLVGGKPEVTVIYIDPKTGLLCKVRMDYYLEHLGLVIDVKSTEDASESGFARSVAKYLYHVQHAHYSMAFNALGKPLKAFLFVAVEKSPPYAVNVHCIDAEAEDRGIELRDRAMTLLNECLASDKWPAYEHRIHRLSLPTYALRD